MILYQKTFNRVVTVNWIPNGISMKAIAFYKTSPIKVYRINGLKPSLRSWKDDFIYIWMWCDFINENKKLLMIVCFIMFYGTFECVDVKVIAFVRNRF